MTTRKLDGKVHKVVDLIIFVLINQKTVAINEIF